MLKDKVLTTITGLLFAIGAACILWVILKNWSDKKQAFEMGNVDCVKERLVETLEDPHIEAIFPRGTKVRIMTNYYQCNNVHVNDRVWYRFSESIPPVVRVVKGIPGDKYQLEKMDDKKWSLKINGSPVMSPAGEYFIQSENIPPLKTYEISRNGILRENEYILLSATPPGLTDSGNLGLIQKERLAGRVLPLE